MKKAEMQDGTSMEERFLRFVRDSDGSILDGLFRESADEVYTHARRILGNSADAEDAVQEAFLQLVRTSAKYDGSVPFRAWLGRLTYTASLHLQRTRGRRATRERKAAEMMEHERHVRELPDVDLNDELREAVNSLPLRYREPISLCYFGGLTQAEAAATLGRSEGTVASQVQRGMKLLREKLARGGVVLSLVMISRELAAAPSYTAPASLTSSLSSLAGTAASGGALPASYLPAMTLAQKCTLLAQLHPFLASLAATVLVTVSAVLVHSGIRDTDSPGKQTGPVASIPAPSASPDKPAAEKEPPLDLKRDPEEVVLRISIIQGKTHTPSGGLRIFGDGRVIGSFPKWDNTQDRPTRGERARGCLVRDGNLKFSPDTDRHLSVQEWNALVAAIGEIDFSKLGTENVAEVCVEPEIIPELVRYPCGNLFYYQRVTTMELAIKTNRDDVSLRIHNLAYLARGKPADHPLRKLQHLEGILRVMNSSVLSRKLAAEEQKCLLRHVLNKDNAKAADAAAGNLSKFGAASAAEGVLSAFQSSTDSDTVSRLGSILSGLCYRGVSKDTIAPVMSSILRKQDLGGTVQKIQFRAAVEWGARHGNEADAKSLLTYFARIPTGKRNPPARRVPGWPLPVQVNPAGDALLKMTVRGVAVNAICGRSQELVLDPAFVKDQSRLAQALLIIAAWGKREAVRELITRAEQILPRKARTLTSRQIAYAYLEVLKSVPVKISREWSLRRISAKPELKGLQLKIMKAWASREIQMVEQDVF